MPLDVLTIRKAKPGIKTTKLFDGGGLHLELAPAGGKWWRWRYRFDGKPQQLSSACKARRKRHSVYVAFAFAGGAAGRTFSDGETRRAAMWRLCIRGVLLAIGCVLLFASLFPIFAVIGFDEPWQTALVASKLIMLPAGVVCLLGAAALKSRKV